MKPAVLAGKLLKALVGLALMRVRVAGYFTVAATFADYPVKPTL